VRTSVETSDVDGVMGGRLDDFMNAYLRYKQIQDAEAVATAGAEV
jgi:hypothetical protein